MRFSTTEDLRKYLQEKLGLGLVVFLSGDGAYRCFFMVFSPTGICLLRLEGYNHGVNDWSLSSTVADPILHEVLKG